MKYEFFIPEGNAHNPDLGSIRILEGEFENSEFQFTIVKVGEKPFDDGTFPIHFEYGVLRWDFDITEESTKRFEDVLATILVDIITNLAPPVKD